MNATQKTRGKKEVESRQTATPVKTSGKPRTTAKHPKTGKPRRSGEIDRSFVTPIEKWLRKQMNSDPRFALFYVGMWELISMSNSSIVEDLTGKDLGNILARECERTVSDAAGDEAYLENTPPLQAAATVAIATMMQFEVMG